MLDPEALKASKILLAAQRKDVETKAAKLRQRVQEVRSLQESELPSERDRIDHGLAQMSPKDIVSRLIADVGVSVDSLRHLAELFPESVMPTKREERCLRCGKQFDPNFNSDDACTMPHVNSRQMWDGSKKSWYECPRHHL